MKVKQIGVILTVILLCLILIVNCQKDIERFIGNEEELFNYQELSGELESVKTNVEKQYLGLVMFNLQLELSLDKDRSTQSKEKIIKFIGDIRDALRSPGKENIGTNYIKIEKIAGQKIFRSQTTSSVLRT